MSMPQPINIAIVASDKTRLQSIKSILELPEIGINPRYYYATPEDKIEALVNPNNYSYGFVELWISLDSASYEFCQMKQLLNLTNPKYSRGYYEKLLPNPIINIEEKQNAVEALRKHTKQILNAFYETS